MLSLDVREVFLFQSGRFVLDPIFAVLGTLQFHTTPVKPTLAPAGICVHGAKAIDTPRENGIGDRGFGTVGRILI